MYSYTDPCTKELKFINADMSSPIVISYYGQVKSFSYVELQNGTFDLWLNNTYQNYRTTTPCQGVFTTTTTTTSTNTVMGLVNNVMTLNSLTNLDLSSTTSSLGSTTSVGATTATGTSGTSTSPKNEKSNDKSSSNGNSNSTSTSGSSSGSDNQTSGQGSSGSQSEGQGQNNQDNSQGSGQSSSSSSSSSSSGSTGSSGSGGVKGETKTETKPEEKSPDKVEEQKTQEQKVGASSSAKAASKARVETQKPAILVTGDIVGIQTAKSNAQDARATMSFTRVKGDGTSSLGLSTDYTINAKIGNISLLKSWIGANSKGNKHINVVSGAFGFLPKSFTSSLLFVRVNSLKNFTALYGASGSYGRLFEQEIISTIAIAGFMYKGNLSKHIDATIIAAGIYSPYTKYYTESLFKSKPIIVPFLNLNYSMTKTFKFGLTAGGTYIANQDIINYQILVGGKLKI